MSHVLDDLAASYGLHELAIEDCRHHIQLAKLDYYDGYSFILIDHVVDRYLPTLDHAGDTIDEVEDALLINPDVT